MVTTETSGVGGGPPLLLPHPPGIKKMIRMSATFIRPDLIFPFIDHLDYR
jgi:hypothetical protein